MNTPKVYFKATHKAWYANIGPASDKGNRRPVKLVVGPDDKATQKLATEALWRKIAAWVGVLLSVAAITKNQMASFSRLDASGIGPSLLAEIAVPKIIYKLNVWIRQERVHLAFSGNLAKPFRARASCP